MIETPFFFQRGAANLFAMLHSPQGNASPIGFVMSHPFGEEKLWSHRVFVSLARALTERGHSVLRFDYMGAGDSSGMTPDTSLESHLADLSAALEIFVERCPQLEKIGLMGMRLGATLAALMAEHSRTLGPARQHLNDAPLLLWDPIMDGANYIQELLRSNLGTQLAVYGKVQENREALQARIRAGGTVNVDGYEIGRDLFDSCARPDLLPAGDKQHGGPTLVVQIASTENQKDREDLQALARSYPRGQFLRTTEQPFWREIRPFYARAVNLQRETLQWLEQLDV